MNGQYTKKTRVTRVVIVIKYMGSKSRIAKYIVPIIQECIDDNNLQAYIEPFVGGANIIDKVKCCQRIGLDKNQYLIALFRHLQEGGKLLDEVPRELYTQVKSNYLNDDYEDWYVGNIGFLSSFNGKWFDGGYAKSGYAKDSKKGLVYRNYYQECKRNIEKQIRNLNDVLFEAKDYRQWQYNSFETPLMIYCDPPYQNTTKYSNSKNFNYDEFWNFMKSCSTRNYVLISEQNAPDDFIEIWEKPISRILNPTTKTEKHNQAVEKLFTYKQGKYAKYSKEKAGGINT